MLRTGALPAAAKQGAEVRLLVHDSQDPSPRHPTPIRWRHARRLVQVVVLIAFVSLIVMPLGPEGRRFPRELFSQLDPLVGLATVVASRSLLPFAAAGLITVVLTLVFGRVWCGWVCPIGTLLDVLPESRKKRRTLPEWARLGKYVTLALVLGSALFGTLAFMFLDPVTIATRPLQEILMPLFGSDAVGRSAGAYIGRRSIGVIALLSLLPLAVVLGLNALGRRTFCRTLCPLGGLLALLSKAPGVRRIVLGDSCTSCARCAAACPTSAIGRDAGFASDASSCTLCMTCVDSCPSRAVAFGTVGADRPSMAYDPSRRNLLGAVAATGVTLGVSAMLPVAVAEGETLRPPSTDEERLAKLCVRCGACFSACPTGALRPSLSVTSKAGIWTPMLDERPPHCSLNCNLCAKVCPTDALHIPTPEEAAELGLGATARVTRYRCVAWSRGKECMKCRMACPIQGAVIDLSLRPGEASASRVPVPWVDAKLCVGCDLCAAACPVRPSAIGINV